MKKKCVVVILASVLMLGWHGANADHPHDARVEVWTVQYDDDVCDEESQEVFFRLHERGYITLYQITSYGRVEVLYPRSHHCQRELRPFREYRLSDLADDVHLYDDEGEAQLGVIFTREPVVLAPWLERSFVEAGLVVRTSPLIYARIDLPRIFARVEADVRIRIGPRCAPVFVVKPVCVRPRVVCRKPHWHHRHGHWPPAHDKRHYGKHGREYDRSRDYDRDRDHDRGGYDEPRNYEPEKRGFERRGPERQRGSNPPRASERKEVLVVNEPSRRERRVEPEQNPSRDNQKQRQFSRRDRNARASD